MATGIWNSNYNPPDFAQKSFDFNITKKMPNGSAPLSGLLDLFPSETAAQVQHGYWTKSMIFPALTLSAEAAAADTVLNVVSTANIVAGMEFQPYSTTMWNSESLIIDSVISATQVRVTRAQGTGTAAIIASGAVLYQTGNAHEEGSLRPNAMNIVPTFVSNYTQIFRDTWALTGTAASVRVVAGEEPKASNKMEGATFHALAKERALIFGQKFMGNRNGQPFHKLEGLISMIKNPDYYPDYMTGQNVNAAGSTTTFDQLETYLDPTFSQVTSPQSADTRVLFVGAQSRKVINKIGALYGEIQTTDGQTSFGLRFDTFKLTRGTYYMIEHPLFNSNVNWSKMALALDLSCIKKAYLAMRDTQHMSFNASGEQATDNGIDAIGGTYTTEMTMLCMNPSACALITNLTAAA